MTTRVAARGTSARWRGVGPRMWAVVLLATLWPLLVGFGESAESRNREGNKLYADGKFDEALTEYRGAQVLAPEIPLLAFNAGDALFRKGALPDAIREYGSAAASDDPLLASAALYNAGTAFLQGGQLDAAVETFKGALKLNPDDIEAKHNLEVALRLLEQQQQQQQQDQQDQQNQDQQDQDQQSQDQQNQDQQDQDQQDQDQQDQDKQDQDQQNQDQQNQDQQDQDQQNQDQQDQDKQDQDQQNQDKQDQDQQNQDQQNQDQQDQGQQGQQGEQESTMSKAEAEQLLDAIGDEEAELQERLRAAQAAKREKVDKDW